MSRAARLRIISGLDMKGPAALLLQVEGRSILLDAGDGPEEDALLDTAALPPLDAVIVSHSHEDHIDALRRWQPGCPVFATAPVAAMLPAGLDIRPLPQGGESDILGLKLTTGASGHAPGGVWLHFALGGGLLYTGDISLESRTIPFDMPPPARHLLIDASYGFYDTPLKAQEQALIAALAEKPHSLLPLPLCGRGGDILLALETAFADRISLEDNLRQDLEHHAAICAHAGLAAALARQRAFDAQAPIVLAGDPHLRGGRGAALLADWQRQGRDDVQVVFTGHVIATRQPLIEAGLARFVRWNVHPRLSDLHRLAEHCRAEHVTPLFTPLERARWRAELGPRFNDTEEFGIV